MSARGPKLAAAGTSRGRQPAETPPLTPASHNETVIVAIGASAGGLEACRKLLSALPSHTGLAFVIVQHLDPTHDSLLVELLAIHTGMAVL